jgi:RNA polymerase sigma-70 factor (ECF subfamily)
MATIGEEQALVERFRRGDDSAFDRIVEQHSAAVAALANRLLGWPGDVDDVVQDVFVSAFVGLKRFRGQCRLRTWLYTITINKCRSHRLRRHRHRQPAAIDPEAVGSLAGGDKAAMEGETLGRVRRAVQALPAKYREVVVLRYLQGMEMSEISGLLGVKTNALQVRLNRAKKQLKEQLNDLVEEDS